MGASENINALQGAGAAMSHVPKRATQHGLFLPSAEVLPPSLKPGQLQLQRQVYGEEARAHKETYISLGKPQKSVYGRDFSDLLTPEDFTNVTKPIKQLGPDESGGQRGASLWRSEYNASINKLALQGACYHRQDGPSYQAANPPTCVSGAGATSSYTQDFGRYGSNPRDRVRPGDTKLPVIKNELTAGTAKGTAHIPGYQGFIPSNTSGEAVARVAQGEQLRSVDKTNIAEVFHTNLVGYAGHVPASARNSSYCERRPTRLTVTGHDFAPPRVSALA